MSNEQKMIELMRDQHKAIADTCMNLEGSIRKLSGIQQDLAAADYTKFSEPLAGPFSLLSEIHGELTALAYKMELECNRMVNESSEPAVTATSDESD